MVASTHLSPLERLLDPLSECFSKEGAQRLLALRVDEETQSKLDDFAARNKEGLLSPRELAEYDSCIRALDVIAILQVGFVQREVLVEEFACSVVVFDRKLGAGNAIVFRGLLRERQCLLDAGMPDIADADLERVGRERMCRDHAQKCGADHGSDHFVSSRSSLNWRTCLAT